MPDIVIAGTGQPELLPIIDDFNSSCIDKDDCYHLLGFIDDNEANQDREILGYKVLGPFDWIVEKSKCYQCHCSNMSYQTPIDSKASISQRNFHQSSTSFCLSFLYCSYRYW